MQENDSPLTKENFTLYKGPILDPGDPDKETIRDSIHRHSTDNEQSLPKKEENEEKVMLENNPKSPSENQSCPENNIKEESQNEQKHWCPQVHLIESYKILSMKNVFF